MNDEMQKALADILSKTLRGVESAGDFLMSQIPEVVQQLLLYHAVKSFAVMTLFFVVMFTAFGVAYVKERQWKKDGDYMSQGFGWFGCTITSAFCLAGILLNMEWLQIWLAPKLYLIEYAAKLVKG